MHDFPLVCLLSGALYMYPFTTMAPLNTRLSFCHQYCKDSPSSSPLHSSVLPFVIPFVHPSTPDSHFDRPWTFAWPLVASSLLLFGMPIGPSPRTGWLFALRSRICDSVVKIRLIHGRIQRDCLVSFGFAKSDTREAVLQVHGSGKPFSFSKIRFESWFYRGFQIVQPNWCS